jgi:hypothetical protein
MITLTSHSTWARKSTAGNMNPGGRRYLCQSPKASKCPPAWSFVTKCFDVWYRPYMPWFEIAFSQDLPTIWTWHQQLWQRLRRP